MNGPLPTDEPGEESPAGQPAATQPPSEASLDNEPGTGGGDAGSSRSTAAKLARLHLRTGAYSLARVELETLAGAGTLDDEALLDLAEVRWRTDDLTGAGEAAAAYIASGRLAPLALIVAAEATAALGRPGEARRLAGRALELVDGPIDPIFAGMPRSDVWPSEPLERVVPPAGVLPAVARTGPGQAPGRVPGQDPESPVVAVPMAAFAGSDRELSEPMLDRMPDPSAELEAARDALAAGDRSGAAIRLAIVLRLAPVLAPAVLDLAAAEPGPAFDLVRGDALRLVGRESQARRSFAAAARQAPPEAAGLEPASDAAADPSSAADPAGAAGDS